MFNKHAPMMTFMIGWLPVAKQLGVISFDTITIS